MSPVEAEGDRLMADVLILEFADATEEQSLIGRA
jgi:hypothetical protein